MGFGEGYKGSHECVGSFEKWLILTKYLHGYRSCTKGPNIFLELWVSDRIQSPVCGSGGLRGQEAGLRGRTPSTNPTGSTSEETKVFQAPDHVSFFSLGIGFQVWNGFRGLPVIWAMWGVCRA